MKMLTDSIRISTRGNTDIIDITDQVQQNLMQTGLVSGQGTLFVSGSTAGITTLEYEPGLLKDLSSAFEKLAPAHAAYAHDAAWGDGNGSAHVRAALLGPDLTVPFMQRALCLGTWQQIVVIDFDNRPRQRKILMQWIGE